LPCNKNTGFQFAHRPSTSKDDAPALQGFKTSSGQFALRAKHLCQQAAIFFHWHGKPVIFFWTLLGGGRSLSMWQPVSQTMD